MPNLWESSTLQAQFLSARESVKLASTCCTRRNVGSFLWFILFADWDLHGTLQGGPPTRYNLGYNSYNWGYNPSYIPNYKAIYRGYNSIYNWQGPILYDQSTWLIVPKRWVFLHGLYNPIHGDCAIYFYPFVYVHPYFWEDSQVGLMFFFQMAWSHHLT